MSSYYPSFNYMGLNSLKDKHLVVAAFDADSGEVDTFLGMDCIYTDSAYGTRRLDYGAKFNNVSTIKLSVIKQCGVDFSVEEVRDILKWMTGSRKNSMLDLVDKHFEKEFVGNGTQYGFALTDQFDGVSNVYINDELCSNDKWTHKYSPDNGYYITFGADNPPENGAKIKVVYNKAKYSFIGRVTNAWQQKMDARTIGLSFEFTSISPWAYSPKQTVSCAFGQDLAIDDQGVLRKGTGAALLGTDDDGVLYNGIQGGAGLFNITSNGIVYVDNSVKLQINNKSDDLHSYVYMETTLLNNNSEEVFIENKTIGEKTSIYGLGAGETVTLSSEQFIISDAPNKMFGSNFNFVWPRLAPGVNNIVVSGSGICSITFSYRVPIKIGDCAMDIDITGNNCVNCYNDADTEAGGSTDAKYVYWDNIIGTPSTVAGYGITDVYTDDEVDELIENIEITGGTCTGDHNVDEQELNDMLTSILGE